MKRSQVAARLERLCARLEHGSVVVGWAARGGPLQVVQAGAPRGVQAPATWCFPAGCLTKLFTWTLIERAVRQGRLELETPLSHQLGDGLAPRVLQGVTLQQLLEHSHGLDDSLLERAPLQRDGRIDLYALCAALARHARAGSFYSYSNAGAWIAAAMLERLYEAPFAALLDSELFRPCGMTLKRRQPAREGICAAMGAELLVSVTDLLRFATRTALAPGALWPRGRGAIMALPGWHPVERGIQLGWKHYGEDAFGHHSSWPRSSTLVRVSAERREALVVAAWDLSAMRLAAQLFGGHLPEYRGVAVPRALSFAPPASLKHGAYEGCYGCAARSVRVERSPRGALCLRGEALECELVPAEHDIFYTSPQDTTQFPFVQFIAREDAGFGLLWNGRRVLVRKAQ